MVTTLKPVFSIISRQPISEQLDSVWAAIQQRGWVNIEATHSLESLLNTGGSQWFVTNLVKVSSMLFTACHVTEILPNLFFIYGVFNDAVSSLNYTALNVRIISMGKERKQSLHNLR